MRPSEGFGIVIRTIGLLFVLAGVTYGVTVVILVLGSQSTHGGYGVVAHSLCFVLFGAVGLYFLRGAPHIVRFAYPETKKKAGNFQQHAGQVSSEAEQSASPGDPSA